MASELVNECIPVEQDANSIWESLPPEVMEEIFARLPADCVLHLRRVCKHWNNLFSSKNFLTLWSLTPKSHQWLILCTTSYCAAYSFSTKKWLAIPLSALPVCSYKGSEVGLFLLQKYSSLRWRFCIFNPLTQTDFQPDPPTLLSLKKIYATCIVKGDHGNDYKVVAVGRDWMGAQVMQIYDSNEKSWKVAGQILEVGNEIALCNKIAFCNSLFFVMVLDSSLSTGIRVCSIQDCTVITFIPTLAIDEFSIYEFSIYEFSMAKLIVCGKLILLVVPTLKVSKIKDIIIWQLESQENFKDPFWKEIARMPQFILDRFDSESSWNLSDCIGLDNCLCFRIFGGTDVVEFNLIERSWEFLSKCPTADRNEIMCCFSF